MFLRAALVQVICPGSRVPGPPRGGPKKTLSLGPGTGEGFTEATSKAGLSCPKSVANVRTKAPANTARRIGELDLDYDKLRSPPITLPQLVQSESGGRECPVGLFRLRRPAEDVN